ncbi:MAG: Smr/MutS family protein, partial [Treponema sp.]|nr:Smr/MutS family protein [Treponema sp.]
LNLFAKNSSKIAVQIITLLEAVLCIVGMFFVNPIFALGIFCRSSDDASSSLVSASGEMEIPTLCEIASDMPSLKSAGEKIFSVISEDGEIRDLPSLRSIRSRIASLKKDVDSAVRRYVSDPSLASALQSTVPVYRQDRELIAVRSDRRGEIRGIVHEVSGSGQTVYVEPEEIVRANNEIIQAEYELQAEVGRIFRELTFALGEWREDFMSCHGAMLELDVTFAASCYQNMVGGVFAETADLSLEPPVILQARHPLLGSNAVPVDIRFMDGKRVMIVTGPNTGGKTVTLKTIALFSLMNQAGFPVPAAEGTRLPYFSSVFADIGDEQSIDESLSTFSSHMKKIAAMIEHADDRSLLLLDELGSGTDPLEGGAIAMSVLDTLIERKSFVVVTTHHGILKNYGYTNPACTNASMEYSAETMAPTYRLLMGVPGESHAIDIALRSGLRSDVVENARRYIASEQADVSALIQGLTAKHAELDSLLQRQKSEERRLEDLRIRLEKKGIANKEKEVEIKNWEHSKSSEFLSDARSRLENLVRELREGEITREKTLSVKSFISDLEEEIESQVDEISRQEEKISEEKNQLEKDEIRFAENGMLIKQAKEKSGASNKKTKRRTSNAEALKSASVQDIKPLAKNDKKSEGRISLSAPLLSPGTEVYAGKNRMRGILEKENKDGSWTVVFGSMKMNMKRKEIIPVKVPERILKPDVLVETSTEFEKDERPVFELRLLGMRQEEAMRALERQLDLCMIYNFKAFSIIHGKGMGILQQSVQDYLGHYPGVKDFRFAPPEDGGSGKTYVTLM